MVSIASSTISMIYFRMEWILQDCLQDTNKQNIKKLKIKRPQNHENILKRYFQLMLYYKKRYHFAVCTILHQCWANLFLYLFNRNSAGSNLIPTMCKNYRVIWRCTFYQHFSCEIPQYLRLPFLYQLKIRRLWFQVL